MRLEVVVMVLTSTLAVAGPQDEVEAATAVADEAAPAAPAEGLSYYFAQTNRVQVAAGQTTVSMETGAAMGPVGYAPFRLFIDNSHGPQKSIEVDVRGANQHHLSTVIELGAGEVRVDTLPFPVALGGGPVTVRGPKMSADVNHLHFTGTYGQQRALLTLSDAPAFQKFVGVAPTTSGAETVVGTLAPAEAPTAWQAYVGYSAVVVPRGSLLTELTEAQRAALDAYVMTGGRLVVRGNGRELAAFAGLEQRLGIQTHGFGVIHVFDSVMTGVDHVSLQQPAVLPNPGAQRRDDSGQESLLPQATAPVGRFMFIISLFTLAIGPGSLWVARRRGPSALLFTIPLTAFCTCIFLIGYSLIADGFSVHVARLALVRLDSPQRRAATLATAGYYANLSPSTLAFGSGLALFGEREEYGPGQGFSLNWQSGLTADGDLLPSRTYREVGFASLEPSRARMVLKGRQMQNALGAEVRLLRFRSGGVEYVVRNLRDGASSGPGVPETGGEVMARSRSFDVRFSKETTDEFFAALEEGEFIAALDESPFTPAGGLKADEHRAETYVRGRYER